MEGRKRMDAAVGVMEAELKCMDKRMDGE